MNRNEDLRPLDESGADEYPEEHIDCQQLMREGIIAARDCNWEQHLHMRGEAWPQWFGNYVILNDGRDGFVCDGALYVLWAKHRLL